MSRPKRKSGATNATAADDVSSPTDGMPVPSDTDIPPPKKRRKTVKRTPANQKMKPAEGPPSLNSMPLDIYYEICESMEPMDILSLSRTSRYIYYMLMDTGSSAIWKKARSLIADVPECPSDLTEAEYARLLFGNDCYRCLKRPAELHTTWIGRFRACASCVESAYTTSRYSLPWDLEQFIPVVCIKKQRNPYNYYCKRIVVTWRKEYEAAENKSEWLQKKIKERNPTKAHADQCKTWARSWEVQLLARRKAKVVARIVALGWGSELARILCESDKPQNWEKVIKTCQKEVTERDLVRLEPYINGYMGKIQNKRMQIERISLVRTTITILEDIVKTCTAVLLPNAFTPSLGDLVALPIVQDMLNDTTRSPDPTAELEILREQFPEISAQWERDVEDELCALIRSACGDSYEFDPQTVLKLAITAFRCTKCRDGHTNGASIWYPKIPVHTHCTTSVDTENAIRWNDNEAISFRKEDMLSLSQVLTQFGFDPKVTTAADMDAANLVFECLSCNSQHVGRCTMRWTMLATHINDSHSESGSSTANLKLLEGAEAECVNRRLDEKTERWRAQYHVLICAHCKKKGNCVGLEDHVRSEHRIANPTEADIVVGLDSDAADFHRLWPPREELDGEILPLLTLPV